MGTRRRWTKEMVREARRRQEGGESFEQISWRYGVTGSHMRRVCLQMYEWDDKPWLTREEQDTLARQEDDAAQRKDAKTETQKWYFSRSR